MQTGLLWLCNVSCTTMPRLRVRLACLLLAVRRVMHSDIVHHPHSGSESTSAWKKKTDVAGVLVGGRHADGCTVANMCQQNGIPGWSAATRVQ